LGTLRIGARLDRRSIHLEREHNISACCDASVGSEASTNAGIGVEVSAAAKVGECAQHCGAESAQPSVRGLVWMPHRISGARVMHRDQDASSLRRLAAARQNCIR
jgi:hypothetical protein